SERSVAAVFRNAVFIEPGLQSHHDELAVCLNPACFCAKHRRRADGCDRVGDMAVRLAEIFPSAFWQCFARTEDSRPKQYDSVTAYAGDCQQTACSSSQLGAQDRSK